MIRIDGRKRADWLRPDARSIRPVKKVFLLMLGHACDLIVSQVAANDMHCLEDIVEAVVELVKDSGRKLNDTNNKGNMVVPNPTIPPGQVFIHAWLLPPGGPNE